MRRYAFVLIEKALGSKATRQPNPEIQAMARSYKQMNGITSPDYGPGPLDEARSRRIADAYENAWHDPHHPAVKASYDALKRETLAQYHHLANAGYNINPWQGEGEPYQNSAAMMNDLRDNRNLHFFMTDNGFGSGDSAPHDHPLMDAGGFHIGGKPLLYNDLFRAVHDFYGHAAEGHQFGAKGEENAWRTHASMFSPAAVPALTSETRGQNSAVNYGSHLRRPDGSLPVKGEPDWVHPANRPFADQKATLLPEEFHFPDQGIVGKSTTYRLSSLRFRLRVSHPAQAAAQA